MAICIAASISLGIYSVKLALVYKAQNAPPHAIQRPTRLIDRGCGFTVEPVKRGLNHADFFLEVGR